MHACIRMRRAYLVQGRSWCSGMKLEDGVDRDGTGLITGLLLRLINTCSYGGENKKMVAAAVGLGGGWSEATLKWPREGNARRGTGFGCSLSLSFLSKGNGNEWAVGKSEMRKSGKVVGYG
ncbi:hypothetical protein D5086_010393 [Populus alba]|uniref:Uncharacterized protein n=1 Tax=Populus alba TaxID=43335 RepID=A0ACC4CAR8_POPAL